MTHKNTQTFDNIRIDLNITYFIIHIFQWSKQYTLSFINIYFWASMLTEFINGL